MACASAALLAVEPGPWSASAPCKRALRGASCGANGAFQRARDGRDGVHRLRRDVLHRGHHRRDGPHRLPMNPSHMGPPAKEHAGAWSGRARVQKGRAKMGGKMRAWTEGGARQGAGQGTGPGQRQQGQNAHVLLVPVVAGRVLRPLRGVTFGDGPEIYRRDSNPGSNRGWPIIRNVTHIHRLGLAP